MVTLSYLTLLHIMFLCFIKTHCLSPRGYSHQFPLGQLSPSDNLVILSNLVNLSPTWIKQNIILIFLANHVMSQAIGRKILSWWIFALWSGPIRNNSHQLPVLFAQLKLQVKSYDLVNMTVTSALVYIVSIYIVMVQKQEYNGMYPDTFR